MSKGSLFWSKASGKLGEVVLSQVKGQQISRAYQPKVANPRSTGQTLQRVKFSNAVKFYKHATQALFKFAFEDKRKNESDYNAFMRKNSNVAAYVTRESYLNQFYPAIGGQYLLADGSLPSLPLTPNDSLGLVMSLGTGDFTDNVNLTVAELSLRLIKMYNFAEGDILTFVEVYNAEITSIDDNPTVPTDWIINQMIISSTDSSKLTDVFKAQNGHAFGTAEGWHIKGETGQEKTLACASQSVNGDNCVAGAALIQSRNVAGSKLLVSRSYLINNKYANQIYNASIQPAYVNRALNSWGRNQEAILQGGLAKNL